jgi:uncharacterized membrane protein YphA (DoxX/SURF4 family)
VDIALWVAAIILATVFAIAGGLKVAVPRQRLRPLMGWVEYASDLPVKALGVAEVAGAVAIVLPGLIGVATVLTPIAAVGLAIVMVGAAIVHLCLDESGKVPQTVVLFVLAVFVAWGRFGQYAF